MKKINKMSLQIKFDQLSMYYHFTLFEVIKMKLRYRFQQYLISLNRDKQGVIFLRQNFEKLFNVCESKE